jgi:hypothetical protein
MFTAEYLLFCAGKAADENGNLSLHGIFDRLFAREFPTAHRPFKGVFKLTANEPVVDKELTLKITLSIDGEEVAEMGGNLKTTVEKGNALVPDVDLSEFVFPRPGNYTVKLFINDKMLIERGIQAIAMDQLVEK